MVVCDSNSEKCMLSSCPECPGFVKAKEGLENCTEDKMRIQYKQWTAVDEYGLITMIQI